MSSLTNKTVLILGGTHGMGLATAKAVIARGGEVLVTGNNEANIETARAEIGDRVVRSDISAVDDIGRLLKDVTYRFDRIDLLHVNAGISDLQPIHAVTPEAYDRAFAVNMRGPFFAVQRLQPHVRDGGAIVFTTSIANEIGMPGMSVYAASKAALWSFAQTLASELLPRKVRVNAVSPGFIKTPTMGATNATPEERQAFEHEGNHLTPLGRNGTVDEIARAVLYLGFEATFTTGFQLAVDGGIGQRLTSPH